MRRWLWSLLVVALAGGFLALGIFGAKGMDVSPIALWQEVCHTGAVWKRTLWEQLDQVYVDALGQPTVEKQPEPTPTVTPSDSTIQSIAHTQGGETEDEELSPSGKPYSFYETITPVYINGILVVNKDYALPSDFGGENAQAMEALNKLQQAARRVGCSLPLLSGYRSFETQDTLYRKYVSQDGTALANTYSAWPGHSEHQTGLAFDVGSISNSFGETWSGRWLAAHAHEYGFIIRYPQGKEDITGYQYEPWHIRYLGVEIATEVYESGLCLEEYLGIG